MESTKWWLKGQKVCEKEMFKTHIKTLKKCSHEDTEHYHMEDVSLDLEDINVSETFALSNLGRLPQKCQKSNQLTPVTIALINTQLGKSHGSYGDWHFGVRVCVTCDIKQNSQKSK